MAADDDPAARHPLTRALALVSDGIDVGLDASLVAMPQSGVRAHLLELEIQERRLHAVQLRLVAASAALDPPIGAAGSGAGSGLAGRRATGVGRTGAWMRSRLHVSAGRAAAELRAAALLDPHDGDLRELGTALSTGRTSAEHVRGACRAITRIPAHLIRAHRVTLATTLTDHATNWAPREADALAHHLLAVLDPDGTDRYDPDALDRRSLTISTDSTGMVITRGQHDPAAGAFLKTAIDLLASYHRHPHSPDTGKGRGNDAGGGTDGNTDGNTDGGSGGERGTSGDSATAGIDRPRPSTHRRHDALDDLVRAGVAHLASCDNHDGIGAAMTRLLIVTTPDQLAAVAGTPQPQADHSGDETDDETADQTADEARDEARDQSASAHTRARRRALDTRTSGSATCVGQGPISAGLLQLAACDAVIDRILLDTRGAVVSMTSQSRYATPAITRALIARDGGCATPGCPAPPQLTHAHHIQWWSRGGRTDTDNLVLLCARHHRAVHAEHLHVTSRGGIPWFRAADSHTGTGTGTAERTWTRGTYTDAATRARQLAQHLAADEHSHRRERWWLRDEEPA